MKNRFRVGFDRDGDFIWDREVQPKNRKFCILWGQLAREFDIYESRRVSVYVKPQTDHDHIGIAIADYMNWFSENGRKWVEQQRAPLIESFEIQQTKKLHSTFLRSIGKPAFDVVRAKRGRHRSSHCYKCKQCVDSEIDMECTRCEWIVCSSCGACGCGYGVYGGSNNDYSQLLVVPEDDYSEIRFPCADVDSLSEANAIRREILNEAFDWRRSEEEGWFYSDDDGDVG